MKVLLVEDCPEDALMAKAILSSAPLDAEVLHIEDGLRALDMLRQASGTGELPDLVVLDLELPSLGGKELLTRIRSQAEMAHLPVILLTSYSEDQNVMEGFVRGANSFLEKPVRPERLMAAVGLLMSEKPVTNT